MIERLNGQMLKQFFLNNLQCIYLCVYLFMSKICEIYQTTTGTTAIIKAFKPTILFF